MASTSAETFTAVPALVARLAELRARIDAARDRKLTDLFGLTSGGEEVDLWTLQLEADEVANQIHAARFRLVEVEG